MQWPEKLGVVLTNWETQVTKFEVADEPVTLVGDPTLIKSSISLKAMRQALRKGAGGFLVGCNRMENPGNQIESKLGTGSHIQDYLKEIISSHEQVFEAPSGLPPKRNHEHAITLKEGSNPVGVKPYRYPQIQKNEIERLITEC